LQRLYWRIKLVLMAQYRSVFEDRRHIQDRDVQVFAAKRCGLILNLEVAIKRMKWLNQHTS
jgi:pyridoxine 5'-phosphate synthase PdxJ